jgi:phosphate starvation-inducible membrane PsiE
MVPSGSINFVNLVCMCLKFVFLVGLTQLVRFLVVELNHSGLNIIFDMNVVFMTNYFFRERRRFGRQRDTLSDRLHESQE